MAKEQPSSSKPTTAPPKLPRLSKEFKIRKRPLLHPAIAPPRSSSHTPKEIYISTSTPFISTVKRVRSLLDQISKRAHPSIDFNTSASNILSQIEATTSVQPKTGRGDGKTVGTRREAEEVVIKATGRAVDKGLRMAMWWLQQKDVRVVIRTGSVGAVDDVVAIGDEDGVEESSRVRRTSCLEVGISLR